MCVHMGVCVDCLPKLRGAFQAVLGPRDWGSHCATVAWEWSSQEAGSTCLCQTIALQSHKCQPFARQLAVTRLCARMHTHTNALSDMVGKQLHDCLDLHIHRLRAAAATCRGIFSAEA